ncbi:hypothetical protein L1049_026009 [Liquidambar formosana]|uniref:5'-3' exonuclease domain-containing protein n=1 Tax=Liquidambar formosana TaxID=63359 RepID=A0AAP0NCC2_LIQFO
MGKEAMSIADSYYLHIKHIGGSFQNHYQLHKDFQGVRLEGRINSSQMFLGNAMCRWVLKIEDHEADDVVAMLVGQVLQRGYRVVIASPDKDFKQLISEDVQIVMPMPEFNRWSFYTLKHYIAQYNCDPGSDLSLRCIMGDEVDGVPGIQHMVPGFGRKTALKLLKRHGSLENLLNAAAVRTVGRQYAQDALTKNVDYLRKNYEVLSLRRDVDIHLQEKWLSERDTRNDSVILSNFFKLLGETPKLNHRSGTYSSNG